MRGKAGTAALILFGYRRAECGRGGGLLGGAYPFLRGCCGVAVGGAAGGGAGGGGAGGGRLTFPVVGCWRRAICGSEAGRKAPHWGTGGRWVVWFILLFMQGLLCQRCLRLRRRFQCLFYAVEADIIIAVEPCVIIGLRVMVDTAEAAGADARACKARSVRGAGIDIRIGQVNTNILTAFFNSCATFSSFLTVPVWSSLYIARCFTSLSVSSGMITVSIY